MNSTVQLSSYCNTMFYILHILLFIIYCHYHTLNPYVCIYFLGLLSILFHTLCIHMQYQSVSTTATSQHIILQGYFPLMGIFKVFLIKLVLICHMNIWITDAEEQAAGIFVCIFLFKMLYFYLFAIFVLKRILKYFQQQPCAFIKLISRFRRSIYSI